MTTLQRIGVTLAILASASGGERARAQTDQTLLVRSPESLRWSPDGNRVAVYLANAHDGELRVYDVRSGAATKLVTGLPRLRRYKDRFDIRWSGDGSELRYRQGTQYWRVPASGGTPTPVLRDTLPREILVLSPEGDRVSFVRGGDLWVKSLPAGAPRRLVTGQKFLAGQAEFYGRFTEWTPWSPDGTHLIFHAQTPDSGLRLGLARVADGRIRWLPTGGGLWDYSSVEWAPDGGRIAISRLSRDFRRKQLVIWDIRRDVRQVVREDTDPEWVDHNILPSFSSDWSPDGRRLALISNQSGWRRVYVADLASGTSWPVTADGFDAGTVWWSPDGERLLIASNEGSRHSVRLWSYPAGQSGGAAILLTPGEGVIENAAARGSRPDVEWSPDGKRVLYGMSRPDDAFQVGVVDASGGTPTVLYSATAEGLALESQPTIRPVEFAARDGAPIPGVLLEPRRSDPGLRRPALVYHYGGWNQQARLGWHLGPKWKLFEYLAGRGWTVLVADVRGSDGYGRAHAHGMYHDGGGRQATDLADAAAWLRQQPSVDPDRIALFGHSYGAYLALTTLLREPDAFQAGVLMAGVFDWGAFAAGTYGEIRFGPLKSPAVPDIQRRPVLHLDRLKAPVLVYHGTNDFNAPMMFSEQLVRGLMKEGRDYEFAVYPDEPHDWDKEETERDFLIRTERFLLSRMAAGGPKAKSAVP